jgi:hypothetical protein
VTGPIHDVAVALRQVGAHPAVELEVVSVEHTWERVAIAVVLRYRTATPVCCDEPGCYMRFLGVGRGEVPAALQRALELAAPPPVEISVQLAHEPGYHHVDRATGADAVLRYDAAHFAG